MTSVQINKTNVDQVEIEFIQKGSSAVVTNLKESLLDGNREYVFSIQELTVPLDSTPMFPITEDFPLFEIHRRNVGASQSANLDALTLAQQILDNFIVQDPNYTQAQLEQAALNEGLVLGPFNHAVYVAGIVTELTRQRDVERDLTTKNVLDNNYDATYQKLDNYGTYTISPNKPFFNPSQMLFDLRDWCHVFNVEQSIAGILPGTYGGTDTAELQVLYDDQGQVLTTIAEQAQEMRDGDDNELRLLQVKCSADGSLILEGSELFFNNFTILMSNYGSALMGFNNNSFTRVGDQQFIQVTDDSFSNTFVNPLLNDQILQGLNSTAFQIPTLRPIYQTCDQRVKVSMHSDLSYPTQINIENEIEGRDRDICSGFFTQKLVAEMTFDPDMGVSSSSILSTIYNGRHAFIKKTDSHHEWHRLINSFDMRLLRFYLQITYRDFSEADNTFSLSKKDFVIPEHSFYQFVVRFVSNA